MLIRTWSEKQRVVTRIECRKGFPTFIATIDDLLFSLTNAEKTVQTTAKLRTQKNE